MSLARDSVSIELIDVPRSFTGINFVSELDLARNLGPRPGPTLGSWPWAAWVAAVAASRGPWALIMPGSCAP